MAGLAFFGTVGQLLFTEAMKIADVTLVMPFDFSKLIWASLFGFFFFAETPGPLTFFGGAIIFASATYVAFRERKIKLLTADDTILHIKETL
jgi:drug/metabolite transporter (DMT)-like permease